MGKSREFDNVLDECLERLLVKGETVEQCLRSFPEHVDTLKPLLETALAINKASTMQPRPEFRDRARYQFSLAFQETEQKKSRPLFSWSWQPRWAVAVAITLVLLLVGSSTVVAAGGSMPGAPLYPVKLATEQVQLALTPSALGKAELYAKLADRRVIEIVRMADENKPEQIGQTAQRLDVYLAKIVDLASPQEVTGELMVPAAREAPVAEKALVPEEAFPVEDALLVEDAPLPPEPAGGGKESPVGVDRRARLRVIVARNAISNSARLRALLETVPQSAKAALLQAIAVSEAGYEKALESLD